MLSVARHYCNSFLSLNNEAKLLLVFYLFRSISAGMTFFIGIFLAHIHMKVSVIGLEVSAIALGNMLGSWLAAKYTDKFNPYMLSSWSLVTQACCFILIGLMKSPLALALIIFLNGVTGYFYISVSSFLITSAAGTEAKDWAHAIGFKTVMSNLGIGIGGVIVSYSSQDVAYSAFMLMGVVLFALSYLYARQAKGTSLIKQQQKEQDSNVSSPQLLMLSLISVGLMGLIIGIQRVGMQFFYEENFSSGEVSFVIMLNTLMIIGLMPFIIKYLQNKNHTFYLGVGAILLGVGTSMQAFCATVVALSALCVLRTLGEMLMSQETEYLCFQSARSDERGKALGYYKLIFSLGTTIGAIFSGEMLELFGLNVVWELSALIGIFSMTLCYLFMRRSGDRVRQMA